MDSNEIIICINYLYESHCKIEFLDNATVNYF